MYVAAKNSLYRYAGCVYVRDTLPCCDPNKQVWSDKNVKTIGGFAKSIFHKRFVIAGQKLIENNVKTN